MAPGCPGNGEGDKQRSGLACKRAVRPRHSWMTGGGPGEDARSDPRGPSAPVCGSLDLATGVGTADSPLLLLALPPPGGPESTQEP